MFDFCSQIGLRNRSQCPSNGFSGKHFGLSLLDEGRRGRRFVLLSLQSLVRWTRLPRPRQATPPDGRGRTENGAQAQNEGRKGSTWRRELGRRGPGLAHPAPTPFRVAGPGPLPRGGGTAKETVAQTGRYLPSLLRQRVVEKRNRTGQLD